LFQAVRETQDEQLRSTDAHEHARARARLLQAVEQASVTAAGSAPVTAATGQRGAGVRWGIGGSLAAAACALALMFALGDRSSPEADAQAKAEPLATLEVRLDGSFDAVLATHELIAADELGRTLSGSDGSRIELAPHGRMRFDELRQTGATLVLEQGRVALAVHHEHDTSWKIAAGPWSVHVTGTQFAVEWEPSTAQFRVAVTEGSVRVEGEGEVAHLRAGDELVRARGKATLEPETLEIEDSGPLAELEPLEPDEPGERNGKSTGEPSKPSKSASGWSDHFNTSDYPSAWDSLAKLPGGIHGEAERASDAKTMLDLADVARFTKHASDTRKLLERLRVRFPASAEAGEAAFNLGRLAADGGSQAKAAVWLELYLEERPNGSLSGDALGRLLDCYEALGKTSEATSTAKRYLARFPNGPHAAKAQKILAR